MRVFNLTALPVDFHGHTIAPNGGSAEYPELDKYITTRDRKLEADKILSFGFLPSWWSEQQVLAQKKEAIFEVPDVIEGKAVETQQAPPPLPKQETADWVEKPIGKKKFRG
jgi:hypothetical protein